MTWSIVARDAATGAFGVAVATRFLAAGGLCPHAESGVGALSTQAMINPTYGARGLALLRAGAPAEIALAVLIDADHLEEPGVGAGWIQGLENPDGSRRELDAVALVKVHGRAATTGNGNFLRISTAPRIPAAARWGSADTP